MKTFKAFAIAALWLLSAVGAGAQTETKSSKERDYKLTPYMFVSAQGGATRSFTNPELSRKWAPMGALSFGAYFTPYLGARLQGNGWQWKEDLLGASGTYKSTYYGGSLDVLVNLTGILFPKRNNLLNVVLIGGYGMQYAKFDADPTSHPFPLNQKGNRWVHTSRLGGQLDLSLSKTFSFLVEGGYDYVHDQIHGFESSRWWPYVMGGLSVKFGHRKMHTSSPSSMLSMSDMMDNENANSGVAKTSASYQPQPKPEPAPAPAPVVEKKEPAKIEQNLFFRLGRSAVDGSHAAKLYEIAEWAKQHPESTIQLTGYADRATGTDVVNQRISERRAAAVKDALVKKGIDAKRITTEGKGASVQPFANNDENRVVVVMGEEK